MTKASKSIVAVALAAAMTAACGAHRLSTTPRAGSSSTPAKATQGETTRTPAVFAQTLESQDQRLAAALLALAVFPRAETHRQVAQEYRRLGVLDKAHEHFTYAVTMNGADAVSYDALARIWRDWGMPQLGLGDAYRAVYYAPESAAAANTLGTLLQAVGSLEDAKLWYARAYYLDGTAWYALNNLCYARILTQEQAVATCQAAVGAAPYSKVTKNNLALAHVAAGDRGDAKKWFRSAGDAATASYNYGIAMMAARAYDEAAAAFREALLNDPQFTLAAARVRQAQAALAKDGTR